MVSIKDTLAATQIAPRFGLRFLNPDLYSGSSPFTAMSIVQLSLYPTESCQIDFPIAINEQIIQTLQRGAAVAIGVSGGKDSSAVAVRTVSFLEELRHSGPVILIHSDLGRIEWRESLPTCQRLAKQLGLELVVVRRQAGDMLDRWRQRWNSNVERYASLSCVRLILPWSTPAMRFCTSELKQQVIAMELTRRFPGKTILSVSGIRREESPDRAKSPIFQYQPRLFRKRLATVGYDWHPIADWRLAQVFSYINRQGIPLHEAYRVFGASRVSCCFCILASRADLIASAKCHEHRDIYRQLVSLELESTFAFQDNYWLADVAPELLTPALRLRVPLVKTRAAQREQAEKAIPQHLLYTRGWPTCVPTWEDARCLAEVRRQVAEIVEISLDFTNPRAIISRYAQLMKDRPSDQSQ